MWICEDGVMVYNPNGVMEVSEVTNIIPNENILYQNFPNPFNPKTAISYKINKKSFVIIKIYDILGKEIAVLVNEQLQPGTYEVSFDASNLPSGLYFYKLTAGDFIAVKKMLMIK
jgi:hypothetical protein